MMKKFFAVLFFLACVINTPAFAAETMLARIIRTGTLRCGYLVWPPHIDKDLKTGKLSGMNYDYVEAIGKDLHLKIDWALEVTPGQQIEALRSNKIDAMCAADGPMYPNTLKYEAFSKPLVFLPFYLYARSDETRFDKDWHAINSKDVKISVIDGDVSGFVAAAQFPQAQQIALTQLGAPGQMMLDVAGKKADIVINDVLSMSDYFKTNPHILKKITMTEPLAVLSINIGVLRNPEGLELLDLLNQSIDLLRAYRKEEAILAPYKAAVPGALYSATAPWQK